MTQNTTQEILAFKICYEARESPSNLATRYATATTLTQKEGNETHIEIREGD
ncbi:unnamed protein product [Acanthoscelides obtectus]|uniref:Uncharacterized protein n=1 Tax=Acanthoscelides obtectus TaxID=200917 RepID=A0A9P0LX67_ACAOB|nr:unnamed protein product [Acanthoscelides obtectus]CAK1671076.1 hypothetical protein AOBTE_LOCUS28040 [Acanthoscelides obtectus]